MYGMPATSTSLILTSAAPPAAPAPATPVPGDGFVPSHRIAPPINTPAKSTATGVKSGLFNNLRAGSGWVAGWGAKLDSETEGAGLVSICEDDTMEPINARYGRRKDR